MELQLVTLEQAKKLKELGFDWKCKEKQIIEEMPACKLCGAIHIPIAHIIKHPTIALALKWFRDVKGMRINVDSYIDDKYGGNFWYKDNPSEILLENYDTYEQAESALLDALIEYVEEQNEK